MRKWVRWITYVDSEMGFEVASFDEKALAGDVWAFHLSYFRFLYFCESLSNRLKSEMLLH